MYEKYDKLLMSNASGSDGCAASKPSGDNITLWMEATGGMKKGKYLGWDPCQGCTCRIMLELHHPMRLVEGGYDITSN